VTIKEAILNRTAKGHIVQPQSNGSVFIFGLRAFTACQQLQADGLIKFSNLSERSYRGEGVSLQGVAIVL
jgi:hypothetical protein